MPLFVWSDGLLLRPLAPAVPLPDSVFPDVLLNENRLNADVLPLCPVNRRRGGAQPSTSFPSGTGAGKNFPGGLPETRRLY